MDSISEARLSLVHPELARRVRQMAEMLEGEGTVIKITQGLRSWNDQQILWLKGRDVEGNIVNPSQVVTHAPPGHSYHNFGLAVDVVPFLGSTLDWNVNHPVWKRIITVGESVGLTSGAKWRTFPDYPHFQLTGLLPESPNDEVRQTFTGGGIQAVWNEANLNA